MEKLRYCVEFVLLTLLLWLVSVIMIFAGSCVLVLSPMMALWAMLDRNDDDEYEEFEDD